MAYTEERSPWPWVVVALGLLAFIAAVIFLTRPAEMAAPKNGGTVIVQPPAQNAPGQPSQRTTIIQGGGSQPSGSGQPSGGSQPSGNTTIIQRNEGGNEGNKPAAGNQPSAGAPGANTPSAGPAPSTGTTPGAGSGGQGSSGAPTGNSTGRRPAGTSGQQTTTVGVQMGEWFVRLNPASIPAGPTHFRIHNVGTMAHGFAIEGEGIDQQGDRLNPGEKGDVALDLPSGDYDVYCYVDGHRESGMEATLRVTRR